MSAGHTLGSSGLDACHCCEQSDAAGASRREINNAAGQPALRYRVGTYGSFLQEMIRRLPLLIVPPAPNAPPAAEPNRPLAALTSREPAEPTLALLDSWASALDVLTFYQERIANEGYLRTATERRSVLELARAVGYELPPGLAASVDLAFTVETALGAPGRAIIERGTKVMSVPGQNEKPQVFETIDDPVDVRVEWNELKVADPVLLPTPEDLRQDKADVYLRGASLQISPGDVLLFMGSKDNVSSGNWEFHSVTDVESDAATNSTRVFWDQGLSTDRAQLFVFRHKAGLFGHNAPDWRVLSRETRTQFGDPSEKPALNPPDFFATPDPLHLDNVYSRLARHSSRSASYVLIVARDAAGKEIIQLHHLVGARIVTRAGFAITTRVHGLSLSPKPDETALKSFSIRDTAVYLRSDRLELGLRPASGELDPQFPLQALSSEEKAEVVLRTQVPGLSAGRRTLIVGRRIRVRAEAALPGTNILQGESLMLLEPVRALRTGLKTLRYRWLLQRATGERLEFLSAEVVEPEPPEVAQPPADFVKIPALPDDPMVGEVATLKEATPSVLTFTRGPRLEYDRASVTILANVVRATHGETVAKEVLGSGGAVPNLKFVLKHKPLTYVTTGNNISGAESTLEVRVNDVRWHEVPSLSGLGPRQAAYTVRIDDEEQATVIFGDGHSGARPPTGSENIVANYRSGLGPEGNVKPNALSLLLTRPIGIRSVVNPLAASGGVAPASLDQARTNTPLNVRASGRVVSLQDAEDTARMFAGVGNAQAVLLGTGANRAVHITIADPQGEAIPDDSPIFDSLRRAIQAAADPSLIALVDTYEPVPFELSAEVLVHPDYEANQVLSSAANALVAAFSTTERPLAGRITEASVLSVLHTVAGVVAAKLTTLRKLGDATLLQKSLAASPAAVSNGVITRAQVLVLALGSPKLKKMLP
jgi:hypothetical protein